MEVLIEAKKEQEVLDVAEEEATVAQIQEAMIAGAQNCVDSRCGCGTCIK